MACQLQLFPRWGSSAEGGEGVHHHSLSGSPLRRFAVPFPVWGGN